MTASLVIVHPFESHKVGDLIVGEEAVASICRGEHANRAVRVTVPVLFDGQTEDN